MKSINVVSGCCILVVELLLVVEAKASTRDPGGLVGVLLGIVDVDVSDNDNDDVANVVVLLVMQVPVLLLLLLLLDVLDNAAALLCDAKLLNSFRTCSCSLSEINSSRAYSIAVNADA
jgi:hypothetical protein